MHITLEKVPVERKAVLWNLLQLYLHDHSQFEADDVDERGVFGYRYFDHYWVEEGRHPFIIRVDGTIAGFALVRDATNTGDANHMAEFFILRRYRRVGIGRSAAHRIFDMFPGRWHVGQVERNAPARDFWRATISSYTRGRFEEIRESEWGKGPVRVFESPGVSG